MLTNKSLKTLEHSELNKYSTYFHTSSVTGYVGLQTFKTDMYSVGPLFSTLWKNVLTKGISGILREI